MSLFIFICLSVTREVIAQRFIEFVGISIWFNREQEQNLIFDYAFADSIINGK